MYVLIHMTDSSWIDHVEGPFDTMEDARAAAEAKYGTGLACSRYCISELVPPLKTFEIRYVVQGERTAIVQAVDKAEAINFVDELEAPQLALMQSVTEL